MIVRSQTTDDVAATRIAVSSVFDGVSLNLSVLYSKIALLFIACRRNSDTYLNSRCAFRFIRDRRSRIFYLIGREWIDPRVAAAIFSGRT